MSELEYKRHRVRELECQVKALQDELSSTRAALEETRSEAAIREDSLRARFQAQIDELGRDLDEAWRELDDRGEWLSQIGKAIQQEICDNWDDCPAKVKFYSDQAWAVICDTKDEAGRCALAELLGSVLDGGI